MNPALFDRTVQVGAALLALMMSFPAAAGPSIGPPPPRVTGAIGPQINGSVTIDESYYLQGSGGMVTGSDLYLQRSYAGSGVGDTSNDRYSNFAGQYQSSTLTYACSMFCVGVPGYSISGGTAAVDASGLHVLSTSSVNLSNVNNSASAITESTIGAVVTVDRATNVTMGGLLDGLLQQLTADSFASIYASVDLYTALRQTGEGLWYGDRAGGYQVVWDGSMDAQPPASFSTSVALPAGTSFLLVTLDGQTLVAGTSGSALSDFSHTLVPTLTAPAGVNLSIEGAFVNVAPVPEPATGLLMLSGAALLVSRRPWRRVPNAMSGGNRLRELSTDPLGIFLAQGGRSLPSHSALSSSISAGPSPRRTRAAINASPG